MSVVNDKHRI